MQAVGRWVDPDDVDALAPAPCQSVGWVRKQTPDFITVYSHDAVDQLGGELCIPMVLVTEVKELVVLK